jgi:hypothetical protein
MPLKANVPYRFTVEFVPALSTTAQLRDLNRRMGADRTALAGLTPKSAVILHLFESLSPNEAVAIKPGAVWFKVVGGGKVSSAVVRSIAVETQFR